MGDHDRRPSVLLHFLLCTFAERYTLFPRFLFPRVVLTLDYSLLFVSGRLLHLF